MRILSKRPTTRCGHCWLRCSGRVKFLVARRAGLRSRCCVVKAIRNSSISRFFVVAMMLFSWLVVTNHCALAQIQGPNATHVHCHASKDEDGKKTPADGVRECCKSIKANLVDQPEMKFGIAPLEFPAFLFLQALLTPAAIAVPELLHDHGPPGVVSFAENVLQRSLLSHAPPACV